MRVRGWRGMARGRGSGVGVPRSIILCFSVLDCCPDCFFCVAGRCLRVVVWLEIIPTAQFEVCERTGVEPGNVRGVSVCAGLRH